MVSAETLLAFTFFKRKPAVGIKVKQKKPKMKLKPNKQIQINTSPPENLSEIIDLLT